MTTPKKSQQLLINSQDALKEILRLTDAALHPTSNQSGALREIRLIVLNTLPLEEISTLAPSEYVHYAVRNGHETGYRAICSEMIGLMLSGNKNCTTCPRCLKVIGPMKWATKPMANEYTCTKSGKQ